MTHTRAVSTPSARPWGPHGFWPVGNMAPRFTQGQLVRGDKSACLISLSGQRIEDAVGGPQKPKNPGPIARLIL